MKQNILENWFEYKSFNLPGKFYIDDIWILKNHSRFNDLPEHQQVRAFSSKLDFSSVKNIYIKNEIKLYLAHLFDETDYSFDTIAKHGRRLFLASSYIDSSYSLVHSFLDLDFNMFVQEYSSWLTQQGFKTTAIQKNTLSEKMEPIKYEYESDSIRILYNFHDYLHQFYFPDNRKEYDKDIWDVRKLPIKVNISPSRPRYTLNFKKINQLFLKSAAKKNIYHRLQSCAFDTVYIQLIAINNFSDFLSQYYPNINSFANLSREIMLEFIAFIRSSGITTNSANKRIGILKLFFEELQLMGLDDYPKKTLLLADDCKRKHKTQPKFFSDSELEKLNKKIGELPIKIARMFFVIENVGMRISDLCLLKTDCLKKSSETNYLLSYYQQKTNKWNTVPINEIVAATIQEAILNAHTEFGDDCIFVFPQTKDYPVSPDTFSYHMNSLVKKHNILDDTGKLLRIKSHTFRGTVATRYANLGIDFTLIKLMLGQRDLGVLKHYVTIHDVSMIESLKPITDEDNNYIANIGHIHDSISNTQLELEINETPLSVGSCARPLSLGKCNHANACFTCRMFKASKKHLQLYKQQLSEAERNIEVASINGFERLLEINTDLRDNLKKIIDTIEGEI